MIDVKLITDVLDIQDAYQKAASEDCGAVSMFIGTTRNFFGELRVSRLTYESYDKMAILLMKKIGEEIGDKWPAIKNVVIHHRLGEVPVGEASIVIATSSAHRKDSIEAAHYAIDRIKALVPIFKKEEYENGDTQWKENAECPWSQIQ